MLPPEKREQLTARKLVLSLVRSFIRMTLEKSVAGRLASSVACGFLRGGMVARWIVGGVGGIVPEFEVQKENYHNSSMVTALDTPHH
jgi:hypothetical protein